MILLVIVNLADDKKEHLDEVALSNMSTMYNNGNLTATDITITGKINFKGGDGTVTTLANPGDKLLTSDSNINANGLVVGQTVDPDWHYGIAIGAAANIEAVTGKIKHNTGWQMYGNGAAWFPVDIEVVGPIIGRDTLKLAKNAHISGLNIGATINSWNNAIVFDIPDNIDAATGKIKQGRGIGFDVGGTLYTFTDVHMNNGLIMTGGSGVNNNGRML